MKTIVLLLALSIFVSAADFQEKQKNYKYQKIDKKFTIDCDCGEPAKIYPYHGEDIPMAKTFPCPVNGCVN